jgi:O-antigen ligase
MRVYPLPLPRKTLIGYVITMAFLLGLFVRVMLIFSENPLVAVLVLIILVAFIALVTVVFLKLAVLRKQDSRKG